MTPIRRLYLRGACRALCAALLTIAATWTAAAADRAPPAPEPYPRGELLVEPKALATGAKNHVLLDVRSEADYRKGHIPGAVRIDHDEWKSAFKDGSDSKGWTKRISDAGIGPQTQVTIYDDASSKDAARIWWILRFWGVDKASLLNGGWRGWQATQRPIELRPRAATPESFTAKAQASKFTKKDALLKELGGKAPQIVDARSTGEFCGTDTKGAKRGGAMPAAKHLEWSDLIDRQTHRVKSATELKKMFAQAGIDLRQRTVTHCQSGGRSSVMAFGLELMGADDVCNYYAGWSEWGNASDTPVVKPPPKAQVK